MREFQQVRERSNWRRGGGTRSVVEPRNPCMGIVERGIQEDGAVRGQQNLQPGKVCQMKAKNLQPVSQTIARNPAKARELIDAGAGSTYPETKVQIMRKEVGRRPAV